jgi:hypothetical protein
MNLIHIVDKLNDKEYIYSNGLEISLQQAANSLVNKLTDIGDSIVEYNIHEDKCEIFINEQVIERGWVWNSKNTTKKILYKLSYISVFNVEQKPKQNEQSVQTEENIIMKTNDKCTSTKKLYNQNIDINFDNFFEAGDLDCQINFGLGYANNTFDPVKFNPFAQKTNIWSAPSNKYAIDYTLQMANPHLTDGEPICSSRSVRKGTLPLDESLSTMSLDSKVNNPFSYPDNDLNVEIKKKLTLPNFGLRHFKQE